MLLPAKDERWSIFQNTLTDADFEKAIIPAFQLNPKVPKDIQDYFKVILKLFHFSYYEYEFVSIALNQSFFAFELALHKKYELITGNAFKGTLSALINWFIRNKYLKQEKRNTLKAIRTIRNIYAHPKMYIISPPSHIDILDEITTIINLLYEADHRKHRNK